jgi:hypothetical protein
MMTVRRKNGSYVPRWHLNLTCESRSPKPINPIMRSHHVTQLAIQFLETCSHVHILYFLSSRKCLRISNKGMDVTWLD